ncbi:MAG: DUF5683 domain-containing protein [Bacteroidales bacterium]|nr:DUF5683 domain-containing protein [Bacteroidales bacterium]
MFLLILATSCGVIVAQNTQDNVGTSSAVESGFAVSDSNSGSSNGSNIIDSIDSNGIVMNSGDSNKTATKAKQENPRLSFAEKNSGAFKLKKQGGRKSPWTAAICSAIFPGLGQMYNGQYYKPPVIYGGAVALGYFININYKERKVYDKEINARYHKDTNSFNRSLSRYNDRSLLDIRNYYQNNFELAVIIAGVVYLLNIVDAIVYAHLSRFDVSPNLSMKVEPYARTNFYTPSKIPLDAGLSVSLTFK